MNRVEAYITEHYEKLLNDLGLNLYHVEYKKQHKDIILRVYVEMANQDAFMDIDACEKASRLLSDAFDADGSFPIVDAYTFEVSSPGIERELYTVEHYKRYLGEKVYVHLYKSINGSKTILGVLKAASDDGVVLNYEQEDVELSYNEISKAHLYCDF